MNYLEQLGFAFFGSVMQELIYWYQLRNQLHQTQYQDMLKSVQYWVLTALMILLGPVGVVVWFYGHSDALTARDYALFGAAFPLIFKASVGALVDNQNKINLGISDHKSFLRRYLLRDTSGK